MAHYQEPHSPRVATMTSPGPTPPLIPVRSPLRPPARSISSQSDITNLDFAAIAEAAIPPEYLSLSRHKSADMIDSLRDSSLSGIIDPHFILFTDNKRPDSLLSLDLEEAEGEANSDEGRPTSTSTGTSGRTTTTTDSSNSTAPSSTLASHTSTTGMTKRHHALHELLSSERAYASDLALIREVHIPLALGEVLLFMSLCFLLLFLFHFCDSYHWASRKAHFHRERCRLPASCAARTNHPRTHATPDSDEFRRCMNMFFGRLSRPLSLVHLIHAIEGSFACGVCVSKCDSRQ
jgi:hypothetical protein